MDINKRHIMNHLEVDTFHWNSLVTEHEGQGMEVFMHPNVSIKYHNNPSNSCWHVLICHNIMTRWIYWIDLPFFLKQAFQIFLFSKWLIFKRSEVWIQLITVILWEDGELLLTVLLLALNRLCCGMWSVLLMEHFKECSKTYRCLIEDSINKWGWGMMKVQLPSGLV